MPEKYDEYSNDIIEKNKVMDEYQNKINNFKSEVEKKKKILKMYQIQLLNMI